MGPLAAFQVLVLAMAAAMVIEGLKPSHPMKSRVIFWTLFALTALIGISTNRIAAAWPAASSVMEWVGSNPATFFLALVGWLVWLRKPWQREASHRDATPSVAIASDFDRRLAAVEERAQEKPNLAVLNILNEERFREVDGELQVVRASIKKLGDLNNENLDYARRQIASLYDALAAVYHRERLQELERYIEAGAKELSAPTERKACYTAEEWEEWEAKERAWRVGLQAWCDLAACYFRGVDTKIMTVSEEQYRQGGVATADQFPEDGLIPYKGFWARFKNWHNWQEDVYRAVHQVAFNGGTAGSRPIFPGAGYLEELSAKSE